MPISIDLILFEPSPNVLYGMPVFIGTDPQLLRNALRGHGEWWDNASMWLVGYFQDPARFELRCEFDDSAGKRYAKRLIPQLDSNWEVEPAAEKAEFFPTAGADGGISRPLTHTWFIHRNAKPRRVAASRPGQLARQRGYWSPCDGALALDLSGLEADSPSDVPALVAELLARSVLLDALQARAECCFLFHLSRRPSQAVHALMSAGDARPHCKDGTAVSSKQTYSSLPKFGRREYRIHESHSAVADSR